MAHMAQKGRDRWIAAFLPAVLAALVYSWGWGRPAAHRIRTLAGQAESARREAPAAETVRELEEQRSILAAKVAQAAALEKGRGENGKDGTDPAARANTGARVTGLLEGAGLALLEQRLLDGVDGKNGAEAQGGRGDSWQIEAIGTFPAMAKALEAVAARGGPAVAETIAMESVGGGLHRWKLRIGRE